MHRLRFRKRDASTVAPDVVAVLFFVSGTAHLLKPASFADIIPRALPGATWLVYASGIAELVCGAGLIRKQRWAPYCSAALLIVVFPANVQMALDYQSSGHRSGLAKTVAWIRLPVQVPLLWAVLKGRRIPDSGT